MKYAMLFLVFTFASASVNAQLFYSAVPLMTQSTDVKTISLASANVAATGKLANYHINPAGIGMGKTLQYSRRNRSFGLDAHQLSIETSFKIGKSAFALSMKELDTGEIYTMGYSQPLFISRHSSDDFFLNGTYAYAFDNGIRVGAGYNYFKISRFNRLGRENDRGYDKGFSVDIGLIYEQGLFENEDLILKSGLGLSLTDFGESIQLHSTQEIPLPTQLRAGGNFVFEIKDELWGQSLVRLNVLAGLSKTMSRVKRKCDLASGCYYEGTSFFKSLYQTWDDFTYQTNHPEQTAKPIQQIWVQTGLEMTVLETLSFRFGFEDAAKAENFLDKLTYGLGLDLYYFSIDYAWVGYLNDYNADTYSYELGKHLQLTGRLPLDGKRPDTISEALF